MGGGYTNDQCSRAGGEYIGKAMHQKFKDGLFKGGFFIGGDQLCKYRSADRVAEFRQADTDALGYIHESEGGVIKADELEENQNILGAHSIMTWVA